MPILARYSICKIRASHAQNKAIRDGRPRPPRHQVGWDMSHGNVHVKFHDDRLRNGGDITY